MLGQEAIPHQLFQATTPAADYVTYPPRNSRHDWILISDEMEFKSYQVIMNRISDRLAVVSEIVLQEGATAADFQDELGE